MEAGHVALSGLLERDLELDRLKQAVQAAAAGSGSVVALEGEAGIGKTSLLGHGVRSAVGAGMRVLGARGGELEREFAHGIVRQLFEAPLAGAAPAERASWLGGAAQLAAPVLPGGAALIDDAEPSAVLHGLYWLAANLSYDRPLLITVDDAHWADDASIAFLSYLARRVDELPIAIVYASRLGEGASAELPAVAQPELDVVVLRPAALSRTASAELVERLLGESSSQQFNRACHIATGGNPYYLNELLRALESDGIGADDAHAERVEQIAPQTIARSTLARLRRLGPAANELVFAVAVLGTSVELRHAAALAALEPAVAAQAADALAAAAILRDGRPLQFIHPIVRTTVYRELAPGRRAAAHRRAAQVLADDGASAAAIAPHLLATEPAGDPWVVQRLHDAAHDVNGRGAPDAACTYLERALLEPPPADARIAVMLTLGSIGTGLLRPGCIDHLRAVLREAEDAETRFAAGYELAWALAYHDRVGEGVEVARDVLERISTADVERRLVFEGWVASTAPFSPRHARAELEHIAAVRRRAARCDARRAADPRVPRVPRRARRSVGRADRRACAARARGRKAVDDHHVGTPNYYFAVWSLIYGRPPR